MSYRIEYLTETTDARSVCHTLTSDGNDLDSVEDEAFEHENAAREHGATGFQIRHVNAVDRIVVIANFDNA